MSNFRSYKRAVLRAQKVAGPNAGLISPSGDLPTFETTADYEAYMANARAAATMVASNPGMSPDGVWAATTQGLAPTSEDVLRIRQAEFDKEWRDYQLRAQKQDNLREQRAAQAQVDKNPLLLAAESASQVAFAGLSSAFQIGTNAVRMGTGAATEDAGFVGKSPTEVVGELTSNTDLAMLVDYGWGGNTSLDPGQGFFIDPSSPLARQREQWDADMMGVYNREAVAGEDPVYTIGQNSMYLAGVPQDSFIYEMGSTIIDGGLYAFDPSMYATFGAGKSLLRTAQGLGSIQETMQAGRKAATVIREGDEVVPAAESVIDDVDIANVKATAAEATNRAAAEPYQRNLATAQTEYEQAVARQAELEDQFLAASFEAEQASGGAVKSSALNVDEVRASEAAAAEARAAALADLDAAKMEAAAAKKRLEEMSAAPSSPATATNADSFVPESFPWTDRVSSLREMAETEKQATLQRSAAVKSHAQFPKNPVVTREPGSKKGTVRFESGDEIAFQIVGRKGDYRVKVLSVKEADGGTLNLQSYAAERGGSFDMTGLSIEAVDDNLDAAVASRAKYWMEDRVKESFGDPKTNTWTPEKRNMQWQLGEEVLAALKEAETELKAVSKYLDPAEFDGATVWNEFRRLTERITKEMKQNGSLADRIADAESLIKNAGYFRNKAAKAMPKQARPAAAPIPVGDGQRKLRALLDDYKQRSAGGPTVDNVTSHTATDTGGTVVLDNGDTIEYKIRPSGDEQEIRITGGTRNGQPLDDYFTGIKDVENADQIVPAVLEAAAPLDRLPAFESLPDVVDALKSELSDLEKLAPRRREKELVSDLMMRLDSSGIDRSIIEDGPYLHILWSNYDPDELFRDLSKIADSIQTISADIAKSNQPANIPVPAGAEAFTVKDAVARVKEVLGGDYKTDTAALTEIIPDSKSRTVLKAAEAPVPSEKSLISSLLAARDPDWASTIRNILMSPDGRTFVATNRYVAIVKRFDSDKAAADFKRQIETQVGKENLVVIQPGKKTVNEDLDLKNRKTVVLSQVEDDDTVLRTLNQIIEKSDGVELSEFSPKGIYVNDLASKKAKSRPSAYTTNGQTALNAEYVRMFPKGTTLHVNPESPTSPAIARLNGEVIGVIPPLRELPPGSKPVGEALEELLQKAAKEKGVEYRPPVSAADEAAQASDGAMDEVVPVNDGVTTPLIDNAAPSLDLDARVSEAQARLDEAEAAFTAAQKNRALAEQLSQLASVRDEAVAAVESARTSVDEARKMLDAAAAEAKARRLGDVPDDPRELAEAELGIVKDGLGNSMLDLDRAVQVIIGAPGLRSLKAMKNGEGAREVYRILAAEKDTAQLYSLLGGKMPVDAIRRLADAGTEDEVRRIFAAMLMSGDLNQTVGHLRTLRWAARVNGMDPNYVGRWYQKAFDSVGTPKYVQWFMQQSRTNVPWAASRHIDDADGMTSGLYDMLTWVTRVDGTRRKGRFAKDVRVLRDDSIRRMIAAADGGERRRVWYDALTGLSKMVAKDQNLSEDAQKALFDTFHAVRRDARDMSEYNVVSRATPGDDKFYIAGVEVDPNIATIESEMSQYVKMPDPREMRRVFSSAKELERLARNGSPGVARRLSGAFEVLFEQFWRTSVLAFRVGYILRNLADIQFRMFLSGHSSAFTNPHGIAALAVTDAGKGGVLGRRADDLARANVDVDGLPLIVRTEDDADFFQSGHNTFMREYDRGQSRLDTGTYRSTQRRVGSKIVTPEDPADYARGIAAELTHLWSSFAGRDALQASEGIVSKRVERMAAKMRKAKMDLSNETAESLTVRYYWEGPGREELDRFVGNLDAKNPLKEVLQTREGVEDYLFGQLGIIDRRLTLAGRWDAATFQRNPELVRSAMGGAFAASFVADANKAFRGSNKAKQAFDSPAQIVRAAMKEYSDPDVAARVLPARVQAPVWESKEMKQGFLDAVQRATDRFFDASLVLEKHTGYLPEFRYAKWDAAAEMMDALSPADAQKVLATAREALKGGAPGSWAFKTLRKVEDAAKRADGSGAYTIDELKRATDKIATDHVRALFYDASQRNAWAHAFRLVSPFAQAYTNSLRVWSREAARHSNRVYAAATLFTAAKGEGTAIVSDPTNPSDALIYTDPATGQLMIGLPVAGEAMSAIAGALSMVTGRPAPVGPVNVASPLNSMNLLFQNSLLPGVGPAITMPVNAIQGTTGFQKLPEPIKQFLQPYVNKDPEADQTVLSALTPAWIQNILGGLGITGLYGDTTRRFLQPAMAQLYSANPDKYRPVGAPFMDEDGLQRLQNDAVDLAMSFTFSRGLLMSTSPGQLKADLPVLTQNGQWIPSLVLSQEMRDMEARFGSREDALGFMADKYGLDALVTLMPTRKFGTAPTTEAYQFVVDNPDIAAQHGSVLSMFFPGGGYSVRMDRWQRERGFAGNMTQQEMLREANKILYTAQVSQLEAKAVRDPNYTYEMLDADLDRLSKAYEIAPKNAANFDYRAQAMGEVEQALTNPTLASTPAGSAALTYIEARKYALTQVEGEGLNGDSDKPWRDWLAGVGEDLAARNPEFKVMWGRVYRGEVVD